MGLIQTGPSNGPKRLPEFIQLSDSACITNPSPSIGKTGKSRAMALIIGSSHGGQSHSNFQRVESESDGRREYSHSQKLTPSSLVRIIEEEVMKNLVSCYFLVKSESGRRKRFLSPQSYKHVAPSLSLSPRLNSVRSLYSSISRPRSGSYYWIEYIRNNSSVSLSLSLSYLLFFSNPLFMFFLCFFSSFGLLTVL